MDEWATAAEIASAVREGRDDRLAIIEAALARIETRDGRYNSFTAVTAERALAKARKAGRGDRGGGPVPPLAGVPFAVKNLFDIAGLPTLAGSKINRDRAAGRRRLAR